MPLIVFKQQLSEVVVLMRLDAPLIARERRPGQFIILQLDDDYGERIPLTIADADPVAGTITILFQTVGGTTHRLAQYSVGDTIQSVLGPLGTPTHIERFGTVVCVGGGIGIAPLHPIVKGLREAGNRLIVILGARSKNLLVFENEMRALADELIVCTDDGSYGRKGLVTVPLKEICGGAPKPDLAFAIGPPVMMRACCEATRPFAVKTMVSLNAIMVDGTGMCGGCRVTVGGQTKFTCVDGPEFDGHLVDFDNLMQRLRAYKPHEEEAHHKCHLEMEAQKLAARQRAGAL